MTQADAFHLEVCVDTVTDALAVVAAGATRIEMNSALELDGLTPPVASCQWLKEHCQVPIVAMLRPQHRSFVYSSSEELTLLRDGLLLLEAGVDGLVFGSLDDQRRLNLPLLHKVLALCGGRDVIFHRAFDLLEDQLRGLEQLIECGVRRVLTSGGAATAQAGLERLQRLHELAAGRIEILPAAGVNSGNAVQILRQIGCRQVHGSFRGSDPAARGPDLDEIRRTRHLIESHSR